MIQEAAVTLLVQHTAEDAVALAETNGKNYRSFWLALICIFALAFLAAYAGFAQGYLADFGIAEPLANFVAYLVPLVALAWGLRVFRQKANSGLDPQGYFLRATQIAVSENGLTSESEVHSAFYKWAAFLKSVETKDHFFLYVDRASALIVPKRHFASEADQHEFGRMMQTHIRERAS